MGRSRRQRHRPDKYRGHGVTPTEAQLRKRIEELEAKLHVCDTSSDIQRLTRCLEKIQRRVKRLEQEKEAAVTKEKSKKESKKLTPEQKTKKKKEYQQRRKQSFSSKKKKEEQDG